MSNQGEQSAEHLSIELETRVEQLLEHPDVTNTQILYGNTLAPGWTLTIMDNHYEGEFALDFQYKSKRRITLDFLPKTAALMPVTRQPFSLATTIGLQNEMSGYANLMLPPYAPPADLVLDSDDNEIRPFIDLVYELMKVAEADKVPGAFDNHYLLIPVEGHFPYAGMQELWDTATRLLANGVIIISESRQALDVENTESYSEVFMHRHTVSGDVTGLANIDDFGFLNWQSKLNVELYETEGSSNVLSQYIVPLHGDAYTLSHELGTGPAENAQTDHEHAEPIDYDIEVRKRELDKAVLQKILKTVVTVTP